MDRDVVVVGESPPQMYVRLSVREIRGIKVRRLGHEWGWRSREYILGAQKM